MAVPVLMGMLSFTVMHFVDQAMVSRLGSEHLAAVGSSGLWVFCLASFFVGTLACVSTFVSQCLGRGESENCARYAWQGMFVAVATGLFAIGLWPVSPWLFRAMGHPAEVTRLEVIYFQVRLFGFVFIAWQTALTCFFQAISRPAIPMVVAFIANVVNIVLDYLLIFGVFGFPKWGIAGAAVATNISLLLQVALMLGAFLGRSFDEAYGTRHTCRLEWGKVRELMRIGYPGGLTMLMDVLTWGVFTSFIVGRFGTVQLAAHNAAINLMHLSFMVCVGVSHAVTPIVGQWIGRGSIATAKARTYTALRASILYMVTMGLIMAIWGADIIALIFSEDPEVIRLGRILLIFAAIFQGFDAINIICMGALRGVGDTRFLMWCFVAVPYGLFMPVACSLAFLLGLGRGRRLARRHPLHHRAQRHPAIPLP